MPWGTWYRDSPTLYQVPQGACCLAKPQSLFLLCEMQNQRPSQIIQSCTYANLFSFHDGMRRSLICVKMTVDIPKGTRYRVGQSEHSFGCCISKEVYFVIACVWLILWLWLWVCVIKFAFVRKLEQFLQTVLLLKLLMCKEFLFCVDLVGILCYGSAGHLMPSCWVFKQLSMIYQSISNHCCSHKFWYQRVNIINYHSNKEWLL